MAFVKEYTSAKDEEKFSTPTWIIDRERGIFLNWEHYGREDNLIRFKLCNYVDGQILIKVDAKDRCAEYSQLLKVRTAKWYDLYNTFMPEEMTSKKEELIYLLVEAIDEYSRTQAFGRDTDIKVKFTPFRDQ